MENRRTILFAVIGVLLFLLYRAWETDVSEAAQAQAAQAEPVAAAVDAVPNTSTATTAAAAVAPAGNVAVSASSERIRVFTDKFEAEIDPAGGDLRHVELLDYAEDKKTPDKKLALLDDHNGHFFILQSGLAGADKPLTSGQTLYHAAQNEFRLVDGTDTLEVPLEATDASGYTVHKVFRFHRGSYELELEQTLDNAGTQALSASPYVRWQRTAVAVGHEPPFTPTFMGLGVYEQKPGTTEYRFEKMSFKDLDKKIYNSSQTGGWIAMLQHYFVAAIIPPPDEAATFSGKPATPGYQGQYVGALKPVAAGAKQSFTTRLYIGPKQQGSLDAITPGLELTDNYGLLSPVAKPLFWVLKTFHSFTGNWGWSIILLTLLVKGAFYPLSAAQYKSAAKMRRFTPRIQELKERFADDRERLNKAMMELYKKEGFNPLAGCWPLLVQMPVFFGLYRVLYESVELRQAPFVLWMQDLSAADPIFIMPVLYGASMWVQQRLSGQTATMDPAQQKVMNVMPIALTGLFLFFPVGLVLYWLVSNLIGIAQQWIITQRLAKETPARR
ncbi:MAG: Inner rane protein translocase component YidC, long form [Nevskia sp.]|nr:Inner rane protein translocase component YidC, long form [Nevskia sp.]